MQKPRNLILPLCASLFVFDGADAGPFSDKSTLGDLMMAMSPTYALGMTIAKEDYKGTLQLAESVFAAQFATDAIKSLELERRPNHRGKKSFPSGHASGAFSGAMFVHKRYGWKPALIPYAMGVVTGWSRTEVRAHYWHDILAGAALSALFTWVLVGKYTPENVSINANSDGANIRFSTNF